MTTKNKQINRIPLFILIVGILACMGIGYIVYSFAHGQSIIVKQPPIASGAGSTNADVAVEASDETPVAVDTLSSYKVPADAPRILKIDSLGIAARVQPMGVNSIGAIQAPVNIYDSGWYSGSSKPGAYGAMFIDGHASGATRQGLFAYLDTLQNGNIISVEKGSGEVLQYKVVHVDTVSKDAVDMNKALRTYNNATEGLNLMTCTGKWIASQKTYDNRVIVYTERGI